MDLVSLYRLMSWLSPSFPIGGYTYSHGLEYAVDAVLVHDGASLEHWVEEILRHGTGRVDAIMFAAGYRARVCELAELVQLASAMRGTSELGRESMQQGRAFVAALEKSWTADLSAYATTQLPYSIAVAFTCRANCIPLDMGLAAYLHAYVSGIVSAGVRLIPVGQSEGQRILANLGNAVEEVVEEALHTPMSDIGTPTPMLDWVSMQHENQHTRLFRS